MRIDLAYNGSVLESYPGQIGAYRVTATKKGDDLTGFYLSVIKDIYDVDPALNDKIKLIAFDLTKVSNLSETEKNALLYCCGMEFGFETISATFEELIEQGYIDQKKLSFRNGILIEIKVKKEKKNSFGFDIRKWRSGLGAYGFSDCTAKKKNSVWNYKIGGEYIS